MLTRQAAKPPAYVLFRWRRLYELPILNQQSRSSFRSKQIPTHQVKREIAKERFSAS